MCVFVSWPLEMDVSLLAPPASNAKEHAGKCACVENITGIRVLVVVDVKTQQFWQQQWVCLPYWLIRSNPDR